MGVTVIPYNRYNDPWASIGSLAGGLMRDNYDQRGQAKVLDYIKDNQDVLNNQDAQRAAEEWQQHRAAWNQATDPTEKEKYAKLASGSRTKLEQLGFGGLSPDTPDSMIQQIVGFAGGNIGKLQEKYKDKRYANMPKLGYGSSTGKPGMLFKPQDISQVPMDTAGGYSPPSLESAITNSNPFGAVAPYSNKVVY